VAWALDRVVAPVPIPRTVAQDIATGVGSRWRSALCLTNDERESLTAVVRTLESLEHDWPGWGIARRKRAAASGAFGPALAIARARDAGAAERIAADAAALAATPGGLAPPPILTGDHLAAAGFPPGRKFGVWLDRLYDLQLEGSLHDPASGIALVRSWDAAESDSG
jgi:hypothetical protein